MGISRTKGPLAGGIETPPGLMKVTVQNCKRLDTPIYIDPKTRKQVDPATWGKKPAKVKTAITHDFDLTKTPRVRPVIPRTETEQLLEKVVTDPLPGLKKPKGKTGPLLGSTRPQDTHKDFWDNLFNRGVGRRTKNVNVESKIAQLWGKREANPEWFARHHKQANSHFKEFENLYKQFMKKGKGGKYLMLGVAAGAGALALLANPEKADASKLSTLRKLQKAVFKPNVIDAAIDTIDKLRPGIAGETLSKINAPKWIKAEQAYTQVAKTVLPKGTKYKNLGPMKNYSEHLKGVKLPEQEVAVFENTVPKEIAQLSNSKFIFSGKDNTLYQSMHNNSVGMHHEEMTSALWHSLDDPSLVRGHILNGKAFLYSPFEGIDKSAWGMNEFGPTRVAVMQKQAERAMDRAKAMLGKAGIAVGGATAAAVGMDTWSPPEATAGVIPSGKMISRLVQATRGLPKKGPASEMMGLLGRWGKKGENFKAKEMEFGLTEWLTAKGDEVVTRQEVIFAATERNALKAVEYFNKHGHTLLTGAGVVAAVAATMDPKDVKVSKIPKVPEEVPVKKMEASELKPANNKITTKLQEENKKIFHTVDVPYDLVKERAGFNPEQWDLVRGFLFFKEGSFIYNKFGGAGGHYDGAFQIGRDAKADALRNMPDNGPDRRFFGHSKAERLEYRNSPVMQERVLAGYWISNHKHLMKKCPEEYGGISKDKQMQVLAYAHIVGVGSAVKYLQGGKAVTDKNNISGLHYLKRMEVLQKASKKDRNWFKSIAEIIGPNVAEAATLTEAQRLGELNPKRVAGTKSFDELHSPPNSVTDDDPAALYTLTDSEVAVAQQLGLTPQQTNNLNGVKEHLHGVASMFEGPPKEHPPAQGTLAQGHIKTYWDKFVSDLGAPVLGPVADTVIQTMMIPGKLAQMCLGAATVALGDAVQTGLETAGEVAKERAWDPNDDTFSMAQKREMKKEHLKKFKERDEKGYMAPIDAKVKELFKSQQKSLYHTLDYYNNLLLKGGWQDPMNEKENFNRTVRTALEFVGPGGKAMQITKGRLLLKEAIIAKRVGDVKLAAWLSKRARGIRKGDTTLTMEGTRFMAFSALLSTAEALGGNESVDFYTKVEGGLATALMASRFKAVRSIQKAMGPGFYQFGEKLGGGILKYLKEARFGGKLFKPVTYKEKLWSKDSLKWWGRMYADKTFLAWSMKRTIRNLMTKVGISDKEADGIYQLMYNDLSSTERILVGEYLSQGWWGARSFMDPKTKKRVGHKIFVEAKNLATGTTKSGKNYTRATPTSVEEITMAARAAGVNDKRIKLVTDRVEHIREMVKAAELTATETVGKGNKPLINEMLYRANLDMGIPSRVMKAQLKIFNNPQHGEMMAKMSIQGRLDLTKRVKKLDVAPEMFDGLKLLMQPARYTSNGYRNMMREIQRMQLAASVRQGPHSSKVWTKSKPELVGSPDWGPLSKMYVTPEVAYQLKNLTRETHHLTAWMDKLLGPWKMGKVVLNPATHGRNIITNVILADLGGLSPWNMKPYAMAFKELRKPGKYFKEAGEELMGGTWMGKDLLTSYGPMSGRSLLNWTLQGTGAGVGAWSGMEFGDSQLGGLGAVAGAALGAAGGFKFAKHAGMLYQAEEQLFRLALFIRQRQLGFSIGDARAHALKYLFNYGEIPQGVKAMRTWAMPFATFSYKALPLIAESAVKHPIRLAKWVAAPYAATAMAMQNMDISEQDWQRVKKSLPSYIERGIFTLLAIKDERGRLQFADATYIMPWGDLSELRQRGLIERTIQHPLWVLAADFMRNRNGIDLPIYYKGDTPKVKVLKSLHHIGVMATPSLTPGIGTNWKLLNDAFHQEKFASTPAQAMSSSYLGVKIKHHEVGKGMAKNRKKLSRQISELKGGLKWKQKRGVARPQDVEYTRDAVRRLRENYREGP